MRKDASKVAVERPRRGSGAKHRDWFTRGKRYRDLELAPFSEHMKPYFFEHKELNEYLNPLYAFLRKSVGRNWNDVYSEVCEAMDFRSVLGEHVRVHMLSEVGKGPYRGVYVGDDGKLYRRIGGWRQPREVKVTIYRAPAQGTYSAPEVIVDPRDNVLKFVRANKSRERKKKVLEQLIFDGRVYMKFHDLWYEYVRNEFTDWDALQKKQVLRVSYSKRAVNKAEKKRIEEYCKKQRVEVKNHE